MVDEREHGRRGSWNQPICMVMCIQEATDMLKSIAFGLSGMVNKPWWLGISGNGWKVAFDRKTFGLTKNFWSDQKKSGRTVPLGIRKTALAMLAAGRRVRWVPLRKPGPNPLQRFPSATHAATCNADAPYRLGRGCESPPAKAESFHNVSLASYSLLASK